MLVFHLTYLVSRVSRKHTQWRRSNVVSRSYSVIVVEPPVGDQQKYKAKVAAYGRSDSRGILTLNDISL